MINVLDSCYDANSYDKGKLSILKFDQPTRGTVEWLGGKFRYNASSEGGEFADKFTYWVKDTKGAESNGATVYIIASEWGC
jgi:hypothetical protein